MKASIGRIIIYVLSEQDVQRINENRQRFGEPGFEYGNTVTAGDKVPAVVVRAWGGSDDTINGQGMLDGYDRLWLLSRCYDKNKSQGTWHWPAD